LVFLPDYLVDDQNQPYFIIFHVYFLANMGQAYANIQGYSLWFNQTSVVNSCVSIHVGSDMTEHQIRTYFLYLNHVNLNKSNFCRKDRGLQSNGGILGVRRFGSQAH
jgi:hypothetical protein